MRNEIKLIHSNGTEEYLTHLRSEERREIGKIDLASLYVPRTEIDPQDIDEGHDRAELRVGGEPWFAGVIEDVVRHGGEKEIIVESPAGIREILEHMGDDQQRRIVDLLDNDSTDRFSTVVE